SLPGKSARRRQGGRRQPLTRRGIPLPRRSFGARYRRQSCHRQAHSGNRQADVAAAALAGRLSAEQAEAVSDGVAANPAKAKELIDKAQHSSLPELNE